MEFLIKTAATAAIVALVLLAARRFGHRTAGLLAGLPFTTVPALGWIAATGGTDLASRTAIGSVLGCILVPLFAMAYGREARQHPPARSFVAGVAAIGCGLAVASRMSAALGPAVVLCGASSLAALRLLQRPNRTPDPGPPAPGAQSSIVFNALLVGIVSTSIASLATGAAAWGAGLLAGLPTLGLVTLVRLHGTQGARCVTPFLRGYVISALGRAVFGTVFACSATRAGSSTAMLVAIVAGMSFCLLANAIDDRRTRRTPAVLRSRRPIARKPNPCATTVSAPGTDPQRLVVHSLEAVHPTAPSYR
jgi:hypothetical protein